jgi:hypothetical protein
MDHDLVGQPFLGNGDRMSTALVPAPTLALPPLYEVEDQLLALLNSEDSVTDEQKQEFERDLAESLKTAVAKRDRVAGFIKMCEHAAASAAVEIKRLQDRKRIFENTGDRLRGYVVSIIESLGLDDKGKLRKLQGSNFTLSARACPASVKITDETKIPNSLKRVRLDMTVETWEAICKLPGMLEPFPVASYYTDGAALKAALEGSEEVPGAELIVGKNTLVVK